MQRAFFFAILSCVIIACNKNEDVNTDKAETENPETQAVLQTPQPADIDTLVNGEPKRIEVQHILISFQGRRTKATRSQADAQLLAIEILSKTQSGEDFDVLVKEYTDDAFPGRYKMTNAGVSPDPARGHVFPREQMVGAFGDIGFKLKVGEIGMANYNDRTSPYGWHIIKRLR